MHSYKYMLYKLFIMQTEQAVFMYFACICILCMCKCVTTIKKRDLDFKRGQGGVRGRVWSEEKEVGNNAIILFK